MIHSLTIDEEIPEHADGGRWPHLMVFNDTMYVADTAGELIHVLDADYHGELNDVDALNELLSFSETQAMNLQREAVRIGIERGDLDVADEDLVTMLLSDKELPLTGANGALVYEGVVPLYITTGSYLANDGSMIEQPVGENVRVLDPSSETNFLTSLNELGIISYRVG